MSNPFSGIITPALKKLYTNAVNAMLASDGMTVLCTLVYPSKIESCPNCEINPATKRSAGIYKSGGPLPFDGGLCGYCSGEGKKETPQTEPVYLLIVWDYKEWMKAGFHVQNPAGYAMSLSNIDLLPKIKRAKEIILKSDIEVYTRHRFAREGEPNPLGCCVGDEAFIATLWKRI